VYLYGYWGLSNVDPRRYKVSSSLLVVLFFKSSFSSRASVGRRGYLRLHSDAQVSDGAQVRILWWYGKRTFPPFSEVPLVGWPGPWPCGPISWWLETCLVDFGSCLVVSWKPGKWSRERVLTYSMVVITALFYTCSHVQDKIRFIRHKPFGRPARGNGRTKSRIRRRVLWWFCREYHAVVRYRPVQNGPNLN